MASPFSIFRQNQWIMLAGMGVLLMVAFVVVPSVQSMMEASRGRSATPVVVELKKIRDKIDEAQLQSMRERRRDMIKFLAGLHQEVLLLQFPAEFRPFMAERAGQMAVQYAQAVFGPDSEDAVVLTYLLTKKADEMGISISNKAVNDFIARESKGKVEAGQIRKQAEGLSMTDAVLFDNLRYELKAVEVRQMYLEEPPAPEFERFSRGLAQLDGITGVTPEERFEYFERTSSRATLEVLPLKISSLAAQLKDPDETVLRAFFEKYKDKPIGNELEPGFKIPYQSAFEYVEVDQAKLDELAPKQPVTDAEIVKHYEANKDLDYVDRSAALEDPLKKPDPEKKPEETPEKTTPEKTPEKKAEEKKGDEAKKEQPKSEEKKADAKSEKKAAEPEKKKCEDDDASGDCQDADAKKKADDKKPADEKKPVDDKKPADDKKADNKKVDDKKGADDKKTPPEPGTDALPPKKYKPLDAVLKDEIRTKLQREAAIRAIGDSLTRIRTDVMRKYGTVYYSWQNQRDKNKSKDPEPARPDLKAVAAKEGFKYGQTKPFAQLDYKDNPPLGPSFVGGSLPVGMDDSNRFVFRAFAGFQPFSPDFAMDENGSRFVFWKIQEIEPHVPQFKDVKDKVLATWKTIEARKKAEELAKAFVKDAGDVESFSRTLGGLDREIPTSLSLPLDIQTLIPEDKPEVEARVSPAAKPIVDMLGPQIADVAFTTRPFAWLVSPMFNPQRPEPPRLNSVEGLEQIDDPFMKAVFSLKEGQLGYAFNRPQSVLYIFRMKRFDPASKFAFLTYGVRDYLPIAASDKFSFVQGRMQELMSEYGVEWVRESRDRRR